MLIEYLERELRAREAQSGLRERHVSAGACEPRMRLKAADETFRQLAFCSNDYLGLANHPCVLTALLEGAVRWGVGSGASHLVSGHSESHEALEAELATWFTPFIPGARTLLFGTGYLANLGLLGALGMRNATIFADKLNHASLIDGGRLSRAKVMRYAHADLTSLDMRLRACRTPVRLIVTDAVFSMDGDLADLRGLLALAESHDAWLIVDDAHGFGVLGERGRGSLEHSGLRSERLIYMGTLGKAVGVSGAFVAASATVVKFLLQFARSYVFTTASAPAFAHAALASLRLIGGEEGASRRQRLRDYICKLRQNLECLACEASKAGWRLTASNTPIQPIVVGESIAALRLAAALKDMGIWVPAIRPPTVPEGTSRLRISVSAAHDPSEIAELISALRTVAPRAHSL